MTTLTGRFETANGSKYLQQLCKHFGHKIEVDFSETQGTCHFVMGPAHMTASDSALEVRFDLIAPEHADAARNVIDRHLETFAFRENFKAMDWSI